VVLSRSLATGASEPTLLPVNTASEPSNESVEVKLAGPSAVGVQAYQTLPFRKLSGFGSFGSSVEATVGPSTEPDGPEIGAALARSSFAGPGLQLRSIGPAADGAGAEGLL